MGFVFHDTETTATDSAFDQILQFAAIHTDHELRELDRFEIHCRLSAHIVPSPGAIRVTKLWATRLSIQRFTPITRRCAKFELNYLLGLFFRGVA